MWPDIDSMSNEEFDSWFQSLDPASQQQVIYQMNYGAMNSPTPAFGNSSPSINPAGYDITSMFQPPADVDAKGNVEPWDLSNTQQGFNYIQDQMTTAMSPQSAIWGGPGSYDPSLYQPKTVYSGPTVDTATPGRDQVSQLAAMQGGSWDTLLARDIANHVAPATAVGNLMKLINDAVDNPDVTDPTTQAILASLPRKQDTVDSRTGLVVPAPTKGVAQYDVESLLPYAQDLAMKVSADPISATGYEDPSTGIMYQNAPQQVYSKAAQAYIDAGLPMPTESYSDEARLNAIAPSDTQGYARQQETAKKYEADRVGQAQRAETNAKSLEDEYAKLQQELASFQGAGSGVGGGGAGARGPADGEMYGGGSLPRQELGGGGARGPDEQGTSLYGQELFPGWAQAKDTVGGVVGGGLRALPGQPMGAGGGMAATAAQASPYGIAAGAGLDVIMNLFGGGNNAPAGQEPQTGGFTTPQAPSRDLTMQNGQWTFGIPDRVSAPNFQASGTEDYSPIPTKKLDQAAVEQARKKADWAKYLVQRDKYSGSKYNVDGKNVIAYQAPGRGARIAADAQAIAMEQQGRTPLTDAYMQRMMGMRGFGMR